MDHQFAKSYREKKIRSFPVYVLSDIIGYIQARKWLLLAQFIVTSYNTGKSKMDGHFPLLCSLIQKKIKNAE